MARFLVTEYQRIRHTWTVEAPDAGVALDSAMNRVPDAAYEKMTGSDTSATPLDPADTDPVDLTWCTTCREFHDDLDDCPDTDAP